MGNQTLLSLVLIFLIQNAKSQVEVSPDQLWAEQQCGGKAAYKSDEKVFNECVAAKLKGAGKKSNSDLPPTIKNGELLFGPQTVEGRNTIFDCKVVSTGVKYVARQPFCSQHARCRFSQPSSGANVSDIEPDFHCTISSPDEGCSKKTWQDCAIDSVLPDDFNYEKCMKNQPGELPAGCPNLSSGSRSNSGVGGVR